MSERGETPHFHESMPIESGIDSKGNSYVDFVISSSDTEALNCELGELREMGYETVGEPKRLGQDSKRHNFVGFGGSKWTANWEPTGPTPPYQRHPGDNPNN